MDIPLHDIGHTASKLLLQLLETGEIPPSEVLQCALIERESVGDAPVSGYFEQDRD